MWKDAMLLCEDQTIGLLLLATRTSPAAPGSASRSNSFRLGKTNRRSSSSLVFPLRQLCVAAASTVKRSRHQLSDSRLDEAVEGVAEFAASMLALLRGDQFMHMRRRVAAGFSDGSGREAEGSKSKCKLLAERQRKEGIPIGTPSRIVTLQVTLRRAQTSNTRDSRTWAHAPALESPERSLSDRQPGSE